MPDGELPDKSDRKVWNRLYHQNADGTFTDVKMVARDGVEPFCVHCYQ